MSEQSDQLLTVIEVSRILRVSPAWVRQHSNGFRKEPSIPRVKLGTKTLFRKSTIDAFIADAEKCA